MTVKSFRIKAPKFKCLSCEGIRLHFNPIKTWVCDNLTTFMSFSSVKIISFDATGTLFDPFPSIGAIYAEVLQEQGIFHYEEELDMRFMAAFHQSREDTPKHVTEKSELKRWKNIVKAILEEDYSDTVFEALWNRLGTGDSWKPKMRIRRTLNALAAEGYKLIITSNWDKRLIQVLKGTGTSGIFRIRVYLHRAGPRKTL